MARAKISRASWMRRSALVEEQVLDTIFTYREMFEADEIEERDGDIYHHVTGADRIDSLAQAYYQNPRLWWVIALANDMDEPISALRAGVEIRIPEPRWVLESMVL